MIVPLGRQIPPQNLVLIKKDKEGKITKNPVLPVAFMLLLRYPVD